MIRRIVRGVTLAFAVPMTLAGCSDLFGPDAERVEDGELTIIAVDPEAPPLTALQVSLWAVKGEERSVEIRYAYADGSGNGKCLRFIVPGDALDRDAEGNAIAPGDSVQIVIRVENPDLYLFEFDPGGLNFDPDHPARLEVRYRWASLDLDGDGVAGDPDDFEIRSRFGLWKQEHAGDSWEQIGSRRDENQQELYADIDGFTRYALAAD